MTVNSSIKSAETILHCLVALNPCGFFTAPGSRNAPFLQTLGRAPLNNYPIFVHFDERALAFVALGAAKASQKPAVIITTSGTALGNLFPAVMEAFTCHIPLIIVSADRPYELCACGANQTCVQDHIYGTYAEFLHLPTLSEAITPQVMKARILTAVKKVHVQNMPLHLNVELREPLYGAPSPEESLLSTKEITEYKASLDYEALSIVNATIKDLFTQEGTVLLAGELSPNEAEYMYRLASYFKLPLLADVQSNVRGRPGIIACYTHDIKNQGALYHLVVNAKNLLIFEGRFISVPLLKAIKSSHASHWFCSQYHQSLDATNSGGTFVLTSCHNLASVLLPPELQEATFPEQYSLVYKDHVAPLTPAKISNLKIPVASELEYTSALNQATENNIFIGNSLVARYADIVLDTHKNIYTNRGISGIDGLIATAAGIAFTKGPTLALIGDTSALYDISSLTILKKVPLRLVIFNNNGGRIFEKFPIEDPKIKNEFFINAPDVDFVAIAKSLGLKACLVNSVEHLRSLLATPNQNITGQLLECRFSPEQGFAAFNKFMAS